MTGGYEREGSLGLVGRHVVIETAHGGPALLGPLAHPIDRDADHGPPQHGQVEDRGAVTHPAAVFAHADIQPQVQAGFDAPIVAIGLQEVAPRQVQPGPGGKQKLGFDSLGRVADTVEAAGQPGRLRDEGEGDLLRGGVKGDEAAGLGAAAV